MNSLESKLQYKNFEKGEFTGSKLRTLDETFELIKNFPWDEQRGQDVSLTGPSVTIKDEFYNYLKIGLYFNGKYCLYYIDTDGNFYEHHVAALADVYSIVSDLFNHKVDLTVFEKHFFSIGVKSNLYDKSFTYSISELFIWGNALTFVLMTVFSLIFMTVLIINVNTPHILSIVPLIVLVLVGYSNYYILKLYKKIKFMSLKISAGLSDFNLSENGLDWTTYNKDGVEVINIYGRTGRRSSTAFSLSEIVWKNGKKLIIPGAIIEPYQLSHKFPAATIAYKNGNFPFSKIYWDYVNS